MPGPRIVELEQHIEWTIFGNLFGSFPKSRFATPPIVFLRVRKESREETLKIYEPILSTEWNGFQVHFHHAIDTCFLVPTLPQADTLSDLEFQLSESLRPVIDGFSDASQKSLRNLAIVTPCGFPLARDSTIVHLKPLLKFRNLERITWVTGPCTTSCVHCFGNHRQMSTPQLPFSPVYWFADPDKLLPFRNASNREPGHWIDRVFRYVKHTITVRLSELDSDWKVPELVAKIIIPKPRRKVSRKFLFSGEVHEW